MPPVTDPGTSADIDPAAWRVLALTSVAGFAGALDLSVMFVAFPSIEDDFPDASTATLSWVLTVFSIVLAALLIPGGRLADLKGRRRMFLTGVALFGVGSGLAALAPDPFVLIAARVVQACGAALFVPAAMTLILTAFPPERRAMAVGTWAAIGGMAAATGPSIGAAVVEVGGWRSAFLLNIVLAAVAGLWGLRALKESADPDVGRLTDLWGSALVITSVGLLALATVEGPEWGWTDPRVLLLASIGIAAGVATVYRSRRHPEPVLDLALFTNPNFNRANIVAFLFAAGFFAMFFGLVRFLTDAWGYDTSEAGLLITPGPATAAVLSFVGGRQADRFGHRAIMVPGALAFALGAAWLLVGVGDEPDLLLVWLPSIVLFGIGIGLVFPSFQSAAVHGIEAGRFGVASATVQSNVRVAATFGVAAAVALIGGFEAGDPAGDFDPFFALLIALALASAAVSTGIHTRPTPAAPLATAPPSPI